MSSRTEGLGNKSIDVVSAGMSAVQSESSCTDASTLPQYGLQAGQPMFGTSTPNVANARACEH